MNVAVVILNWNGKSLLETFLPAVISHSPQANVYVADNASTDDSVAFIKSTFPTVSIIQNTQNGGYAKGYNDALKSLTEDIFILLNSDVEVTSNWLDPILECFNAEANTAIIQPKVLDYKRKDYFEYAGAAGGFIDTLGYPYCRGRIFNVLEKDEGQFDDTYPIFWASGACLAIRRDVFQELHGLDEDFFAHQEEIDLCWRAKNHDYDIKYVGASSIYHVGGATLSSMNPQKTFFNFRNTLFAIVKNVHFPKAMGLIFTRLLLDGIAALKFLFEGKPRHLLAVLKAHLSFYAYLPKMIKKRKNVKFQKHYSSVFSIVFKHFILGIERFHKL